MKQTEWIREDCRIEEPQPIIEDKKTMPEPITEPEKKEV